MWLDFILKSPGGRVTKSVNNFNMLIHKSGLKDIGLLGANFTWSNLRSDSACCGLDRSLLLPEWEEKVGCVKTVHFV